MGGHFKSKIDHCQICIDESEFKTSRFLILPGLMELFCSWIWLPSPQSNNQTLMVNILYRYGVAEPPFLGWRHSKETAPNC